MLSLLLLSAAADQFSGLTFTSRQVFESSTTFVDCLFTHCQSDVPGAALWMAHEGATAVILSSDFQHCWSSTSGGGVMIAAVQTFVINSTTGLNCSAADGNDAWCSAFINTTSDGSLGSDECSSALCEVAHVNYNHVTWFGCGRSTNGSTTYVTNYNATANYCHSFASGLSIARQYFVVVRFVTLSHHSIGSVMFFDTNTGQNFVECVGFYNNTYSYNYRWGGIFLFASPVTLYHCVFLGNGPDLICGRSSVWPLTLVQCVYDYDLPDETYRVSLTITDCLYRATWVLMDSANCPWPDRTGTPAKSATQIRSPSQSQSPSPSHSPSPSDGFTAHIAYGARRTKIIHLWYFTFAVVE